MSRVWRASDEAFRVRLEALIERDGVQGVARFYDVSASTVRNWNTGRTSPRSDSVQRSVARRGRALTGTVIQDTSGGRFSSSRTIYDPQTVRMVRTIQTRRTERAQAEVRNARNPAQRRIAERNLERVESGRAVSFEEAEQYEDRLTRLRDFSERMEEQGIDYYQRDEEGTIIRTPEGDVYVNPEWVSEFYDEYLYFDDWEDFRSFYSEQ